MRGPEPDYLIYLAVQLNQSDHPEDLQQIIQITDHPEQSLQREHNPQKRQEDLNELLYYRANALQRLSELGVINPSLNLKDRRAEVGGNSGRLAKQKGWEEPALSLQMEFLVEQGDYANAIKIRTNDLFVLSAAGDKRHGSLPADVVIGVDHRRRKGSHCNRERC